MLLIARLIRTVTGIVVLVIVIGILLWVLSANHQNTIVSSIQDAANWLVGPFKTVFSVKGAKLNLALNWGLAAVVYAVVGGFLANLVARSGAWGRRIGRVGSAA